MVDTICIKKYKKVTVLHIMVWMAYLYSIFLIIDDFLSTGLKLYTPYLCFRPSQVAVCGNDSKITVLDIVDKEIKKM